MQSVDGPLGLAELSGNLAGRQAAEVAEQNHLPLFLTEARQGLCEL